MREDAALAVIRFGLGAARGEIGRVADQGAMTWLTNQLAARPAEGFPDTGLTSAKKALTALRDARTDVRSAQGADSGVEAAQAEMRALTRGILVDEILARAAFGAQTENGFLERLTLFWSNHFTVSSKNQLMSVVVGAHEREAIRPNILGSFRDLLHAAVLHPAMLLYLDNAASVGPSSRAGRRFGRGLNENLAREILELHTLSSTGGYIQEDVTEFSRALTGWTVGNRRLGAERSGETFFAERIHEPGVRTIMGKKYAENGAAQALAILDDLAIHPSTARYVAFKLARHFVADKPPPRLVSRLTASFLESGGDLRTVYRTLIAAPEAWSAGLAKIKTPNELLTSAARELGLGAVFAGRPRDVFTSLAQRPFDAASPEGWPDIGEAWTGPDAIMKRLEWANRVGERSAGVDARAFVEEALGPLAAPQTRSAVARAASGAQALTLALMSPEFQRR